MCVKLFSKENFCDNCNSKLSLHYTPIKTKRFIKTFKCNKCGLIQSIPQSYFKSHPKPSMSVDADRSSIMYTKKRFLPRNIKLFRKFKINFNKFENILDIGANRGSFVQYVRSKNKKVKIFAVESKKKIFDYKKYKKTEFSNTRFEDAVIQSDTYDFIYCVHTLEHFVSSKLALLKMFNCLKVGGKAFIVVPNMNFYSNKSIVEYFIDTHTFHFTNNSLIELFNRAGLQIIKKDESSDLTYYLEKSFSKNIRKKNNYFKSTNGFLITEMLCLNIKIISLKIEKKLKNFGKKIKKLNKNILFLGSGQDIRWII